MDVSYKQVLLNVADEYVSRVQSAPGRHKALATIAAQVVNSSSVFERLRAGRDLNVDNLEALLGWFRDYANWPEGRVPQVAARALASIGKPARPLPHGSPTRRALIADVGTHDSG